MPRGMVRGNAYGRDPMRAQSFRTQRAELPEDLWQPLYDRSQYAAAGTTQVSFFSTPRGGSATLLTTHTGAGVWSSASRVKTFQDTNIENANVVPTKMFKIVGVSLAYIHQDNAITTVLNASDREALRAGSYIQFRIVDKDIIYLPLVTIPELNPITAVATTVNAATITASAGGGGSNVPMYKFPIPITINPYENFTVSLNTISGVVINNIIDVYLVLHAYMRRPT